MANEVEIVVTAHDRSGPAFDSARRNAKTLGSEGGSALDSLSGSVKGLGVAALATAGFIAIDLAKKALGALIDYAGRSITAASDLNESLNAVNVVFKNSAKQIEDWGKTQANAYGLSQRAFNEMATPLGALLKNQGVAQDKLADTTINLTKRAADLASVFNTDVSDALEALTAGLRGETDPLERYGVSLSAAKVEAEALAMTHKKTAASLTDTEKAAARLKLIFEQTNDVAGDFQNTSDGLANSTRILQARQEELQATIGEKLLPVMTKLNEFKLKALEFIANEVLPLLESNLRKIYEGFQIIWEKALPFLKDALAEVQKKWEENKDSIMKLQPLLEALGAFLAGTLVAAITVVIGWVILFIEWCGKVGDAFERWKKAMDSLVVHVLTKFGEIIDAAVNAFGWIPGLGDKLKDAQGKFHEWANNIIGDIQRIPDVDINVALHGAEAVGNALSALRNQATATKQMLNFKASGGITGAASGKITSGSLTMVGEYGPEIVSLPTGSKVYSHGQSKAMMDSMGSGGWGPIINIYVQGSIRSDRDLVKIIRDEFNNGGFRGVVRAA